MIPYFVYGLCTITSGLCSIALFTQYRRSGVRMLFWSGICFAGFTLNNLLLVADYALPPSIDLSIPRTVPTLLGIFAMIFAFIWEAI